jgi:hypothetical protein
MSPREYYFHIEERGIPNVRELINFYQNEVGMGFYT